MKSVELAFSLVELLVVVAIIGILSALLLPAVSRSKEKGSQIYCAGNLRQLGLGLQNFVSENQEYPRGWAGTNGELWGPWSLQIERGGLGVSKPDKGFLIKGVWRCPSAQWSTKSEPDITPASYGYNEVGVHPGDIRSNTYGLVGRFISNSNLFAPIRESEVAVPSDMMAIGESFTGFVFFTRQHLDYLEKLGFASKRHNGRVNVVFCDGHVESLPLKFVFEDTSDVALVRWNRDHKSHRDDL